MAVKKYVGFCPVVVVVSHGIYISLESAAVNLIEHQEVNLQNI